MKKEDKLAIEQLHGKEITHYPNFITFEGGEGSGKSTVLKAVAEQLTAAGYAVFVTREPGGNGTRKAEAIREVILSDEMEGMDAMTEAFLYAAARNQHVTEIIRPKVLAGVVVMTDRYIDSSIVYQGLPWGNTADIMDLNMKAIHGVMPKHTLFFDVLPEIGIARVFAHRQAEINHLDKRDISFHQEIYTNYQALAAMFPERYVRVDASKDLATVISDVYNKILAIIAE